MKTSKPNDLGTQHFLVDQCEQIDVNDFVATFKAKLKPIVVQSELEMDHHKVSLTTSEMVNGGIRYWFVCPMCLARVGKLYKHPLTHMLACRLCHKLEYRCRRYKGMVESEK